MIALSLSRIAQAIDGMLHPDPGVGGIVVDGPVVTDSRQAAAGSLYLARVGATADGHAFVADARRAGAVAAVTSRPVSDLPCIVVADVQEAFERLTRAVLEELPELTVIGITGSSGKTTTKDLLAAVLSQAGPTVANTGSLNNEVGVPLTACRVTTQTRYLILEMGARGIGHIEYLTGMVRPSVSLVLNVGSAHAGEFGGRQATARAKGELVAALPADGLAVLNADDPLVAAMAERTSARVILAGQDRSAQVRAEEVSMTAGRASFTLQVPDGQAQVRLRVLGVHQVDNALAVAATAWGLGMSAQDIATALSAAEIPSRFRMEAHELEDGVTVINDAYNANPESMAAALRTLAALGAGPPRRRTWAVLGQMLELGADSAADHARVGALAAELGVDHVVAVGEPAREILAGIHATGERAVSQGLQRPEQSGQLDRHGPPDPTGADRRAGAGPGPSVQWVQDAEAACQLFQQQRCAGDIILVKASNSVGLWSLGERLSREVVSS